MVHKFQNYFKKKNKDSIEIIADLEIGYSFAKDVYTSHVKYDIIKKKIYGWGPNFKNLFIIPL